MKISLMVLSAGSAAGKALSITTPQFIIGRDQGCNLRPASAMISKRHCAVIVKDGKVFLRDFESTNGTFLNDLPVKGEVPIKHGDTLKVGPLSFKVVIEGSAVNKPTPPPKPRTAEAADDDAAAALLSIDDDLGVSLSNEDTSEDQVPGGSTMMDLPSFPKPEATPEEVAAEKKSDDEKKQASKSKPATGAAQDAARAILEKMRQGKRK